jgi:NitT/TauT family transport system substrate-binding protein
MKITYFMRLLPVILLVTLLVGCQYVPTQPLDEVTVQLKTVHQVEFAGFYIAQEKGYYAKENLKVNFLVGEKDLAIIPRVIYGTADFAVISPESTLIAAGKGSPLTAIAVIFRESPIVYVSMADSGIVRPRDFIGKTVATLDASGSQKDLEVQLYIMMKNQGLDASQVKMIAYDPEYVAFSRGQIQATPCYSTIDLVRMKQNGLKLNLIWPSEYGAQFYSDTLVTTDRLIEENPGLVARFLRATLRGWQDAIEDNEEAVEATLQYTLDKDPQLQMAMMESQVPLIHTGEDHIGWIKPEKWQQMYDLLREQGLLEKPFDVRQMYNLEFLQEIYGGKAR